MLADNVLGFWIVLKISHFPSKPSLLGQIFSFQTISQLAVDSRQNSHRGGLLIKCLRIEGKESLAFLLSGQFLSAGFILFCLVRFNYVFVIFALRELFLSMSWAQPLL